ncbi:MAG: NuoM family protein [Bacillaceae bacterium]
MMLSLLVLSPIIGMIALAFINRNSMKAIRTAATITTAVPLMLSIYFVFEFIRQETLDKLAVSKEWIKFGQIEGLPNELFTLRFELGLNGISLLLVFLTALLSILAVIVSYKVKKDIKAFYLWMLLLEVGMLGVFVAESTLLFFLFFEITLVPMFFLISRWGRFESEKAAYQFLIYNGVGSAILLMVFIILFAKTGYTNIEAIGAALLSGQSLQPISENLRTGLFIALLVAFGIKLPILPFHRWMVSVHTEAPVGVVMLHAGVLLKIGAYGLIRFGVNWFPEDYKNFAFVIGLLGVINLLYGAFIALVQTNLRSVLAYSSISHMGIVLMGLGAANFIGFKGAIFQVISHGLIAAFLFFIVGKLEEEVQTTSFNRVSGLAKVMPITAGFFLAGTMASLGLPGMSGFVSEFLAFLGLFQVEPVLAAVGALGIILTAAYLLRAALTMTFGKLEGHQGKDLVGYEYIPAVVLIGFILLIGIYPTSISFFIETTFMKGLGG